MAYAETDELAKVLNVRLGSDEDALQDVLDAAALEIDSELGRSEPFDFSVTADALVLPLLREVNIERAVEHWQQRKSPFGLLGLGSEFGPAHTATDSWERHARKLAPLKESFGIA